MKNLDEINRKINPVAFAGMQFETVAGNLNNKLRKPSSITDQSKRKIIASAIEMFTNVDILEIKSKSRRRNIVEARQLYFYFLDRYTQFTLTLIGELSNRGHATVIYGIRNISDVIETDKEFRELYKRIEKEIDLKITEELEILI